MRKRADALILAVVIAAAGSVYVGMATGHVDGAPSSTVCEVPS